MLELLLLLLEDESLLLTDESFPLTDELPLPVSAAHTINADDITIAAAITAAVTFFKLLNFIISSSYLIILSALLYRE